MDDVMQAGLRRRRGKVEVIAPSVGWWRDPPAAGSVLVGGQRLGTLEVLNRRYVLVLPPGTGGRVEAEVPNDRRTAVEFGQTLLTLAPPAAAEADRDERARSATPDGTAVGDPSGFTVVAPTDGVFYRRPSPGAPPFVETGGRVRTGQPIGLVESMKTFNPILYGGPGLPEEAEVVEILCADEQEVRSGEALLVVR